MVKQFKEGGRYLVSENYTETLLELTVLEISKKGIKIKYDNGNSQWYLKDTFPYKFVEELPIVKQTIKDRSNKIQFDDDAMGYEPDEPQFTLKITEENDIEVNSKLEWESNPREKLMTWFDAMEYARTLSEGWRLPTKEELIDAYDNNVRGFHPDYYWSSSTYAQATSNAWGVDFYSGSVTSLYKTLSEVCVRCVREIR